MKKFTELSARPQQQEPASQSNDKQYFIKRSLAHLLNRSQPVIEAVFGWLLSFPSGITKKDFLAQSCKLEKEDSKAIQQLEISKGKRTIHLLPRQKPPKLEIDVAEALAEYSLVAIEAASGKKVIEGFLDTLPTTNGVYILDVNELVINYVDYQHRGKAGEIIDMSNRADILVVSGLEKPIALAYHIKDTLYQLASVRKKYKDKYTLSTWNYTHMWYIPEYGELFRHFSV